MLRRDEDHRNFEDRFHGAYGRGTPQEFDDFDYGRRGGSFQSFSDESGWKNSVHSAHHNHDHFGFGHRDRGWVKNIDQSHHVGKGPRNYQRSAEKIQHEAFEILTASSSVNAQDIEVSVEDGILTLSGTVSGRKMKREAENLVERISGVSDVVNLLRPIGEALLK